jgi:uncharacterized spore protein YtfJ
VDVQELMSRAQDAITVKRVFGEPYERDGIVVIPAARVGGGGGGGGGEGPEGGGRGAGFGLGAQPVGAYVIQGGTVRWQPALDVTQIVLRTQALLLALLLLIRAFAPKGRRRASRRR